MKRLIGRGYLLTGSVALLAFSLLLAACGANAGAASNGSTAATPTCGPNTAFKSVTGKITATGAGSVTVTDAKGAQTVVLISSTTRITRVVTVSPTALTTGTSVQVLADASATTARRIVVLQGGSGFTGGGFGRGAGGTPPAGVNTACFQRRSQTPGTGFQGLRGTVDSASGTKLTIDDPRGQTFTLTITSATIIETSASGTQSDLMVGAQVQASGIVRNGSLAARNITIQSAGQ